MNTTSSTEKSASAPQDPGHQVDSTLQTEARHKVTPVGERRTAGLVETELIESILATLPYWQNCDDISDQVPLYQCYIDSVSMLEARRNEILHLLGTMKQTSVEIDVPEAFAESAGRAADKMLAKEFNIKLDAPANLASASLAGVPIDELRERFRAAIQKATQKLVAQLMSGMNNLVNRKVAGRAHWPCQNAVNYDFHRRRIYSKGYESRVEEGYAERRDESESPLDPRRWKQVNKRIESTDCICVSEHHTHEAINAFYTTIENSTVVMPDAVQQLVDAVPAWMRPSIRVIDGYLIGERVHSQETCREKVVQTSTVEIPLYGYEPAVLLGPFVLAGWGPREIEETLAARELESKERKRIEDRRFWFGCAAGGQLLTTLFLIASGSYPALFVIALLLFLASVPAAALALRNHLACRDIHLPEWHLQLLVTGVMLGFLGVQCLFLPIGLEKLLLTFGSLTIGACILYPNRHLFVDAHSAGKEQT